MCKNVVLISGLLFFITLSESHDYVLRIKEVNEKNVAHVQMNDNLALTCYYQTLNFGTADLEWFIPSSPNEPVKYGQKAYTYRQDENSLKALVLVVRSMSADDAGRYICRLGRQEGYRFQEMARVEADVFVKRSIVAVDCPKEQWIPLGPDSYDNRSTGGLANIRCVIEALPIPIIDWRFKGHQITTNQRYIVTTVGITIINPQESDAGIYTVIARQEHQTAVHDLRVYVFSRPKIIMGPQIVQTYNNAVIAHREAYLQCLAQGKPLPTVHWYHERDPQTELQIANPQKFFVNTNGRVGMLRIAYAKYPEDSGTYICRAKLAVPTTIGQSNGGDFQDEAQIQISVNLKPRLVPLSTMHRFVDLGDMVTVQCRVRATEPLEFYFQKLYADNPYVDGRQPDDPRIHVRRELDSLDPLNHNLFLTIEKTTLDDTWNYTCHANNLGGKRWWNTTVRVMQVPQMFPRINLTSRDELSELRFGWRNNATNLTCISKGMPHPDWTWYRRGQQILNSVNSTFTIISWDYWNYSQSWLQIKPNLFNEHFIYDEYVCKATNLKGTNSSRARLERASVPGQPRLTNYTVTQSTLELLVSPPTHDGGMPILDYEITYKALGGPLGWYGPVRFPLDASSADGIPKFILTGFVADTGYELLLHARSIVGRGTPLGFSVRTLPGTRPGPVEVIHSGPGLYPYSHVVNWIPPFNGGSPLIGYRIRIRAIRLSHVIRNLSHIDQLKPQIKQAGPWQIYVPDFDNPYLDHFRISTLDPDQVYQFNLINRTRKTSSYGTIMLVIEAQNQYGYSLDGINLDEYGYLNRTPASLGPMKPNPYTSRSERSLLTYSSDLIPTWTLFQTPVQDEWGPPPRIYGSSTPNKATKFICILSTIFTFSVLF